MNMRKTGTLLACALGLGTMALAQDMGEPDAVIKYRQNAMASVGGHIGGMVAILRGEINDPEGLALHATALAAATNSTLLSGSFSQNTHGLGNEETTATAKIWEDWDGFQEQLMLLEAATADIAALAVAGELTEFDQLMPALSTCGACHRELGYREN